jgi:two-component system, OmpR family, phosphate regulon response regulator PhoB
MDTTIMLIDEPTRLRDLLSSILRMRGYAVLECDGGQDAMRRLRHVRPDLIIVEAILPLMSGFEICSTLRRDPILQDVPTLMMCSQKHHLFRGGTWKEHVPADEFIARPFGVQELLARIAGLIHPVPDAGARAR